MKVVKLALEALHRAGNQLPAPWKRKYTVGRQTSAYLSVHDVDERKVDDK
jgi:hypothetical protein